MVFARRSPPHKQKPCQKGLANKSPCTQGKNVEIKKLVTGTIFDGIEKTEI
jgi:hypothetical protein